MLVQKASQTYVWTHHSRDKMRYYRLSEARVKRIIRHPARVEEGIVEGAMACMQPSFVSTKLGLRKDKPNLPKNYSEVWVMYAIKQKQIIVITAWRYPGKSPERDPVPQKVLSEVRNIIAGI